tara:strand:+ start:1672 stop:2199 length:528 start_codon:yes stop_codon:yes gene_type:complete
MAGNANSGRTGKPAIVHVINGNPGRKSKAALHDALDAPAVPVGAPPKPDWLTPFAAEEWDRVLPDLMTLGLVATLDMMALTSYCEAVADYRTFSGLIAERNAAMRGSGDVQTFSTGAKQISVWRQLRNDAEKRANAAGAQFGFSPMARRNLRVTAPPQGELFPNEQKDAAAKYFG